MSTQMMRIRTNSILNSNTCLQRKDTYHNSFETKAIAKVKLSSHKLFILTGKWYKKTP